MTRRERDEQAEVDFQAKHYRSEFDEPEKCDEGGCSNPATVGTVCALHPKSGILPPEFYQRGMKMPEAAPNEQQIVNLGAPFKNDIGVIQGYLSELRAMPPSLMKAKLAKEYDSEAKRILATIEASEGSTVIKVLHKLHKLAVGTMQTLMKPANELRAECQRVQIEWARQLQRKQDEERREREAAAKAEQERERLAQVEHLKTLNKVEEAKQLEMAPMAPISLPDPVKPAGKIEGVSIVQSWTIDPADPFDDPAAFFKWLTENPAAWGMIELKLGPWKTFLTSNKGTLRPPGLKILEVMGTRTRE